MVDEEDDNVHVTRESYSHLRDSKWEAVGRVSALMGEPAVSGMLESLDRDGQHTTINNFLGGELAVGRQKLALLNQQGSQHAELLRLQQVQTPEPGMTHTRRPEILKIHTSKYRGVEKDSILR